MGLCPGFVGAHREPPRTARFDKLVHVGHGGLVVLPSELLAVQRHEVRLVRVHDLGREAQDRPSEVPRAARTPCEGGSCQDKRPHPRPVNNRNNF